MRTTGRTISCASSASCANGCADVNARRVEQRNAVVQIGPQQQRQLRAGEEHAVDRLHLLDDLQYALPLRRLKNGLDELVHVGAGDEIELAGGRRNDLDARGAKHIEI